MKTEIIIPSSMTTASIAFVLDVKNERETIFIGSYENIHDYLVKGKSSADIQAASRKLGTLAEEMNELGTYNTHSDKRRVKKCRNLICPFPTKLLQSVSVLMCRIKRKR